MRILALLLILAAVAAIAYLIYRVIKYGQRIDPEDRHGRRFSSDKAEEAEDPAERPFRRQKGYDINNSRGARAGGRPFYAQRRLYEGYEDAAAEEPGDDYDGKEGRRMEDREKQRQRSNGGNGGSSASSGGGGTIIYFHMDGCGHCRRFDPVWKDFRERHGKELESAYGVRLEAYEAQDALAQELDINGFPTVVFVDEDGSKRGTFEKQRTVDNLRAFAEDNAKKSTAKEE